MKKMNSVSDEKIKLGFRIVFLAMFYLLPLLPVLYSKTSDRIMPITGYSLFVFLEDRSDMMLYAFSLLYVLELIFVGVAVLFALCCFLILENQRKKYFFLSFLFLILAIISSASDLVLSFYLKGNNLYPNFGVYADLVYLVCVMITDCLLSFLLKKRRKAFEQK